MDGLKQHTHEDRRRVVDELVPLIRAKFGEDLLAIGASGSFARREDGPYSDLELVALVARMPPDRPWAGMGRIRDGLLIELEWMTPETWLSRTREVGEHWHIAASDRLAAIVNPELIGRLNAWRPDDEVGKCLRRAAARWNEVCEATAKVLNAARRDDPRAMALVAWDMLHHMLIEVALLNATPFTTLSRYAEEALAMPVRPQGLEELIERASRGRWTEADFASCVEGVFVSLESLLRARGLRLYAETIDPDQPAAPASGRGSGE
jgi:kanamycin nucleotidyltransferase